jgi:hypothetical protein
MEDFEVVINDGAGSDNTPSQEPTNTETVTPEPQSETPSETPQEETTELYELPDGRKVDAQTVASEYKNLLSDYTRKSQALANYEKSNINNHVPKDDIDDTWVPETYEEILAKAEERIFQRIEEKQRAEQEFEQQITSQVDSELAEIKKANPSLDENKLFEHATKYKFPNLSSAFQNMQDMNKSLDAIREQTAKSVQKRNSDPVAIGTAPISNDEEEYSPNLRGNSLKDYLRAIKQK